MCALNKNALHMVDPSGSNDFLGKRMGEAGHFALLFGDGDGAHYVVPVREWFEFSKKTKVSAFSLEEAESLMKQHGRLDEKAAEMANRRLAENKLAAEAYLKALEESETIKQYEEEEEREKKRVQVTNKLDDDDIDFEFEWSDDDVNAIDLPVGGEEENSKEEKNPLAPPTQKKKKPSTAPALSGAGDSAGTGTGPSIAPPAAVGIKREREDVDEAKTFGGAASSAALASSKKTKSTRPRTADEVKRVIAANASLTVRALMEEFGFGGAAAGWSAEEKEAFKTWMEIVKTVGKQVTVGGQKMVRIRD